MELNEAISSQHNLIVKYSDTNLLSVIDSNIEGCIIALENYYLNIPIRFTFYSGTINTSEISKDEISSFTYTEDWRCVNCCLNDFTELNIYRKLFIKTVFLSPNVFLKCNNIVKFIILISIFAELPNNLKGNFIKKINALFLNSENTTQKNYIILSELQNNQISKNILDEKSLNKIANIYLNTNISYDKSNAYSHNENALESIVKWSFEIIIKKLNKLNNSIKDKVIKKAFSDLKLDINFIRLIYTQQIFKYIWEDKNNIFGVSKEEILEIRLNQLENMIECERLNPQNDMFWTDHIVDLIDKTIHFDQQSNDIRKRIDNIHVQTNILSRKGMSLFSSDPITYYGLCDECVDKMLKNNSIDLTILDIVGFTKYPKVIPQSGLANLFMNTTVNTQNISIKTEQKGLDPFIVGSYNISFSVNILVLTVWNKVLRNNKDSILEQIFNDQFKLLFINNPIYRDRYTSTTIHIISYFERLKRYEQLAEYEKIEMYESMILKLERLFIFVSSILDNGFISDTNSRERALATGFDRENIEKVKKQLDNNFDYFFEYFYTEYFETSLHDNKRSQVCHYMNDQYYHKANDYKSIISLFITIVVLVCFINQAIKSTITI